MNAEKQRIAGALRRAGYDEPEHFVRDTEQVVAKLSARPKRARQDQMLRISAIAAVLALFLAFGMPWVVRATEAIIGRLFSQRAEQIEQKLALPEDEKHKQTVERYYDGHRSHALDASAEFMGVIVQLSDISVSPDDRYDTGSTKGWAGLWLCFSEIPSFDPNLMEFKLRFDGNEYPMVMGDAQKYYLERGTAATPEDWASWEGAGIAAIHDGVPCASVDFALPDWRIGQKTEMVLSGSIEGQTFEIPFVYDPALALANSEQAARERMPLEERGDKRELAQLQRAAEGAGQVGYVKQSGPVEFTVSELSKSGNELYLSVAYKGGTEKNPKTASMAYLVWWLIIDGQRVGRESEISGQLKDGVYTTVNKFMLPANLELGGESLVYVKLEMGSLDGKDSHNFGDTSDYENYGYAAFRYNWNTKTATLPADEAQDAGWIAESERNHYFFTLPWTGKMMQHADDGLEISVMNVTVIDQKTIHIMPYVSALATWKRDFEQYEFATDELTAPVFTVNGQQMPFSGIDYLDEYPNTLMFDLAGVGNLNQGDQCELSMPVRVIDKGKTVYEGVFCFKFKLGVRKA